MTISDIPYLRLFDQHIAAIEAKDPVEVVRRLGGHCNQAGGEFGLCNIHARHSRQQ